MDAVNHHEVHLKIADFGLSLIASKGYGDDGQVGSVGTVSGSMARPMRWMAPESIRRRQYSENSDVWAFGVTMWEMWTYAVIPYCHLPDDLVGSK
eukprot:663195-Hanusia_phi.AAC.1